MNRLRLPIFHFLYRPHPHSYILSSLHRLIQMTEYSLSELIDHALSSQESAIGDFTQPYCHSRHNLQYMSIERGLYDGMHVSIM